MVGATSTSVTKPARRVEAERRTPSSNPGADTPATVRCTRPRVW
jgi:hypothetical protein